MKKLLLFLCLIAAFSTTVVKAQPAGTPDMFGYVWYDNTDTINGPTYNWIDVPNLPGAVSVDNLGDDNTVGPFSMGFNFPYYWYSVSQFWVGSNGYIEFSPGQISSPFPTMPATSLPQDVIGAYISDLNFDGNGNPAECWYWTSPGGDSLIVAYINVPFWQQAAPTYLGSNTFEIILTTVDSSVTVQYNNMTGTTFGATQFLSTGIENNSGQVGLQHSYDNLFTGTPRANNYAVKYYYPDNSTFTVNDASCLYNDNPTTGGRFLSNNGGAFTMLTEVSNTGNQTLNPFNVESRVVNLFNQVQAIGNVLTDTLIPGATQVINHATPFNPTSTGIYRYITTTQLTGDATPSNNTKVMEIVVVDTTTTDVILSFDNGINTGQLSWAGGGGGVGVEFVPPFYPAVVTEVQVYIVANPNTVGFSINLFDDNGPNGMPGTLLDSQYVAGPSVLAGIINPVLFPTPVTVTDGSIFVAWVMDGDGVAIGTSNLAPISNRTYEILGNTWADYRSRELEDFQLNLVIDGIVNTPGINENYNEASFGQMYPNPTNDRTAINYDFGSEVINSIAYQIVDVTGKVLREETVVTNGTTQGTLFINTAELSSGVYFVNFLAQESNISRKFTVAK